MTFAPASRALRADEEEFAVGATSSVVVLDVTEDSPALAAGIQPGDVIVAIGGETLETAEDLLAVLRSQRPGDTVALEIVREGASEPVEVEVSSATFPQQADTVRRSRGALRRIIDP